MFSSFIRRYTPAFLAGLAFLSGTTEAQTPPTLTITGVSDFEGNSGTKNFGFRLSLSRPSQSPVSVQIAFLPVTSNTGPSCTDGVDFIQPPSPTFFNIAENATEAIFDVTICGDAVIEPDETFTVFLGVTGAECGAFPFCSADGIIRDDDGTAVISINNLSANEPPTGTRTSAFTVSLAFPIQVSTIVNFTTRDGTARGAVSCAPFIGGGRPDYVSRSGALTIPANALSGGISVTICGDNLSEPSETLFMDLSSSSSSSSVSRFTDATGQAIIRNFGVAQVGEFALSPGEAQLEVDEKVTYTVNWTVPEGKVWRDLDTIDFRIRGGRTALWVRWDEAANTFKLCRRGGGDQDDDRDEDVQDFRGGPSLRCGPGATPGSAVVLETPLASLHLDGTSVVGSGPTGPSVTLGLTVSFERKAAGHGYGVELAATDDFGNGDNFFRLGTVSVERP